MFPWAREGEELERKYVYTVHSELNAILNYRGGRLDGAKMYVTLFPCNECAKAIIQAGIRELIYDQDMMCRRYAAPELTTYVGYPCAAMKQELLKGEWYQSFKIVPFEQYAFRIPVGYEGCLTVFYGPNYMELPPIEKQKTHHAYKVWYKD